MGMHWGSPSLLLPQLNSVSALHPPASENQPMRTQYHPRQPIRGQYLGHVTNQYWPVLTNQRPVFTWASVQVTLLLIAAVSAVTAAVTSLGNKKFTLKLVWKPEPICWRRRIEREQTRWELSWLLSEQNTKIGKWKFHMPGLRPDTAARCCMRTLQRCTPRAGQHTYPRPEDGKIFYNALRVRWCVRSPKSASVTPGSVTGIWVRKTEA